MEIATLLISIGQSGLVQKSPHDSESLRPTASFNHPRDSSPGTPSGGSSETGGELRVGAGSTGPPPTTRELTANLKRMEAPRSLELSEIKSLPPEHTVARIREASRALGEMKQLACRTEGQPAWREVLVSQFARFDSAHNQLQAFMTQLQGGAHFELPQLLAVQIQAQNLAQNLEMLSKAIELTAGGFKTVTQQTQV